jgi:hypothetical protein
MYLISVGTKRYIVGHIHFQGMFRVPETALASMHIHVPERMNNGGRAYFVSANYARPGVVARDSGLSPVIMK